MRVFVGIYNSEGGVNDSAMLETRDNEFVVVEANRPGQWKLGDIVIMHDNALMLTPLAAYEQGLYFWGDPDLVIKW